MPKVVFSPPLPGAIMESAQAMVPAGFDPEIIEDNDPQFFAKTDRYSQQGRVRTCGSSS